MTRRAILTETTALRRYIERRIDRGVEIEDIAVALVTVADEHAGDAFKAIEELVAETRAEIFNRVMARKTTSPPKPERHPGGGGSNLRNAGTAHRKPQATNIANSVFLTRAQARPRARSAGGGKSLKAAAGPPNAPSTGSGAPSAGSSTSSSQKNAPTTSPPQDTMQIDRELL
jgi:hypothetical protein